MQADDFLNAYLVLKENSKALIERLENNPGKPLIGTKELGTRITGGVEIVCLAFSVELYIKDLYCALNVKAPRDHDILKLFEALPEQIRQNIFAHESISQNPFLTRGDIFSTKRFSIESSAYDGFIDQLKAISDGFTKWRYSYESSSLHYDISFALAFIESIKATASEVR
jgi:hypothetical protein